MPRTLEEGVVFPQNKAARIDSQNQPLFTLNDICAAENRADTNHFIFHELTSALLAASGVLHQSSNHRVDFHHKYFRLHLATLNAQQLLLPSRRSYPADLESVPGITVICAFALLSVGSKTPLVFLYAPCASRKPFCTRFSMVAARVAGVPMP
ncbi:MAG: hypothetical protein ACLUEF_02365 [Faecalibacterium prausnitzii]